MEGILVQPERLPDRRYDDDSEKLRSALTAAYEKLVEQQEIITQLSGLPLVYATVIKTGKRQVSPDSFYVGARVRVKAGRFSGRIGTIDFGPDRDGDVKVVFTDGGYEFYGITRNFYPLEPVGFSDSYAVLSFEGKVVEVELPDTCQLLPGDSVKVNPQSMSVVEKADQLTLGEIGIARRVLDNGSGVEVDYQGSIRVVTQGNQPVVAGDRVVLDSSALVIKQNLGRSDERFVFNSETNVTWDDIGGLQDVIDQMKEAVELPHLHPQIYRFYGKKPLKGVLLYGPPGCGKTMLGKATASALAQIYRKSNKGSGFIYVKGPEILDKYVGVAESTIRQIFASARKHKEGSGYPAVIFIDEADSILGKRGMGISSDIERTIVPMFLSEMDGLEDSGAVVLLATNRPDILDPAVVRDGRIDRKVRVRRPDLSGAVEIFQLYLRKVPLSNGYNVQEAAVLAATELFDQGRVLYKVAFRSGEVVPLILGNLASGAMIASIVDQATSEAMKRDLRDKQTNGLCLSDLKTAVGSVFGQNTDLDHTDDIVDFASSLGQEVAGVQKAVVSRSR